MEIYDIQRAVAIAIHEKLDVIEAMPALADIPMEKLESAVESYVDEVHQQISNAIVAEGQDFILNDNAEELRSLLMRRGIRIPSEQLLKICQSIIYTAGIESRCILDFPDYEHGSPMQHDNTLTMYPNRKLWYSKMRIHL